MKKLFSVLALGMFAIGSAHAGVAVNALGGLNFQNDSVSPQSGSTSAVAGLSYGLTGEFGVGPTSAIEVGVISVGAKTKTSTAAGSGTVSVRAMAFPVLFRFDVLPMLDIGVGGYYGILPNKYTIENSNLPGMTNGTYPTTSKSDYGLQGGVRLKLPLAPMFKFLVDASYTFGLKDTGTAGTTEKTRAYALMGGVSIGF